VFGRILKRKIRNFVNNLQCFCSITLKVVFITQTKKDALRANFSFVSELIVSCVGLTFSWLAMLTGGYGQEYTEVSGHHIALFYQNYFRFNSTLFSCLFS